MLETVSVTVSQLNRYIKSVMDSDYNLRTVFVSGEISNFTNHYRTGHFYMTLKDEKAAVPRLHARKRYEGYRQRARQRL